VVEKLAEIIRGVSTKSIEQWNDTKSKTVNLYHTVLNRIKEKEIQIKTEYVTVTKKEEKTPTTPDTKGEEVELKELTTEAQN
jgi:7-cyano-7-deazaguanine synthase in queuosine biosynthesis